MAKIIIIGGGAAGMYASVFAASEGHEVHVFEKNEKLGKKLFITGKGRCNLTNSCSMEELFAQITNNSRFLYSAFYSHSNQDTLEFFRTLELSMKVERGNRVFPASDHSSDVIRVLERRMKKEGVQLHLNTAVHKLLIKNNNVCGVQTKGGEKVCADAVFVATGGCSYPTTGSTGDGYTLAKSAGHTITSLTPSLVPMETKEEYVMRLQGLSLRNVTLCITDGKKELFHEFGELLFTHFGISGPLVLTASSKVGQVLKEHHLKGIIDLKPALSMEQLDTRILREFQAGVNRQFKNIIQGLFPARLLPVMLALCTISPDKKVHEITKIERLEFVALIKNFPFTITGLRGFKEAIITKGGVCVKEINPSTMESKLCRNLYFIGEVIDLDALTGGFNLQIAWSTAYAAANAEVKNAAAVNGQA